MFRTEHPPLWINAVALLAAGLMLSSGLLHLAPQLRPGATAMQIGGQHVLMFSEGCGCGCECSGNDTSCCGREIDPSLKSSDRLCMQAPPCGDTSFSPLPSDVLKHLPPLPFATLTPWRNVAWHRGVAGETGQPRPAPPQRPPIG